MKAGDEVPVISAVMGTTSGAASYAAFTGSVLIMIRDRSKMFIWGPGVVKAETGEDVDTEHLGGAYVQSSNGTPSLVASTEEECIGLVKRLVHYLAGPQKPDTTTPATAIQRNEIVGVPEGVFDVGSFLEFRSFYATNLVTGLAKLAGKTVGLVATNKDVLRGFFDIDACHKLSKFVSMCNALRLPLVTFLDSPGFYPATKQEKAGIISASAEAMKEYASDRSPKVTVVSGEAYGGVFVGFASRALGARKVFAFPGAKMSVMSLSAYIEIFQRKKLEALDGERRKAELDKIVADFNKQMDPAIGVSTGYIDEVIQPAEARAKLIAAFEAA
jgi:acetyl-CoA carboxylase carboxyltransferase component